MHIDMVLMEESKDMKIVDFKKEQGHRDIYEYFEFLSQHHEIKYYNTVRTPDDAAFGFINSMMINAKATDADLASYMKYITYTFTLGSVDEVQSLFAQFEGQLDAQMPDVKCIYCCEDDRFLAIFNKIDSAGKPFVENYEMILRNVVVNTKA